MEDFVENNIVKFWMEEDIIFGLYKKGSVLTIDSVKDVVKLRIEYQKGATHLCVAYITFIDTITADARQYLAKEGYQGIEKLALITNSRMTTILGNIYIMVNKPVRPTRLFRNKEDAVKWLRENS